MAKSDSSTGSPVVLDANGLAALIAALKADGYRVIGPRAADGAVICDDIDGIADLPAGLGDAQAGGSYRLVRRDDDALFGYTVAPQGWKRFLYPPRQRLFAARRDGGALKIAPPEPETAPTAFLGVRACELAAIAIQTQVFGDKGHADPGYNRRLGAALVIAVECTEAGENCFCASMGTGPAATSGYDVRLVELPGHRFVADAASTHGKALLAQLPTAAPTRADLEAVAAGRRKARADQTRRMNTAAAAKLKTVPEHPHWDDVAERCLACGNCTMVCPTCFCTTVEDVTDLTGDHAERVRHWDSCFSLEFSYVHGGAVRTGIGARYRQWITHKLSTWIDQFGTSGCVGCGRCITWCPVGIDITAEVAAIAASLPATRPRAEDGS